jgi:hypothetical protein
MSQATKKNDLMNQPGERITLPLYYSLVPFIITSNILLVDLFILSGAGFYFNSGFLCIRLVLDSFEHYMSLLNEPEIWYRGFPDLELLNYAHRSEGPMPWQKLHS